MAIGGARSLFKNGKVEMIHSKWQRGKRSLLYSNRWIRLHKDMVIDENGVNRDYCVVGTKGGVGVVPISKAGEVFLVAQYRYPPDIHSLEIPKGAFDSFDSRETPLEAAKRELMEETGITAGEWKDIGVVNTLMGYSDDLVHLFCATDLTFGESNPDTYEQIEVVKMPLSDVWAVTKGGLEIMGELFFMRDATSIAAIALASMKAF